MQNMTHTSALGALVDQILSEKDGPLYLSDQDIQKIGDLNTYLNAYLEYTLQVRNNQIAASMITSPVAGYGAAKLIDTNTNPKEIKTLGTVILGVIASKAADVFVSQMITSAPQSTDDSSEFIFSKAKVLMAAANDAIKALTLLKEREKITDAQFLTHKTAIEDEIARTDTLEKVKGFVDLASAIASGYHGYKRNGDSIGYGLAWALTMKTGLGVALAQGYAKPIA